MANLKSLIEIWKKEIYPYSDKTIVRNEIIKAIHDYEGKVLEARYLIKYFDYQDVSSKEFNSSFHREDFYRFPLLEFLFFFRNRDARIYEIIEGVAYSIKEQLVLLDFEKGVSGMPRWSRNIRFTSNYLKNSGLIKTVPYQTENEKQVRKWSINSLGIIFYIFAKDQYSVYVSENNPIGWGNNFDRLLLEFEGLDTNNELKIRSALYSRNPYSEKNIELVIEYLHKMKNPKGFNVKGIENKVKFEDLVDTFYNLSDEEIKEIENLSK